MFDVMADWLTVPLLHYEGGKPPQRLGLAHPSIAPYGVFTTHDGQPILLAIQSDREWVSLATTFLDDAALASDSRFATNVQRVAHREATDALVARAFGTLDEGAACERLIAADVAFARVNDMAGLANHPHLRRVVVDTPEGQVTYPAPAPIVMGEQRRYGPVPALGAGGGGAG